MQPLSFQRIRRWSRHSLVPWLGKAWRAFAHWWSHRFLFSCLVRRWRRSKIHKVKDPDEKPSWDDWVSHHSTWSRIYWSRIPHYRKKIWRSSANSKVDAYTSNDARFREKTLIERKILIVEREIDLQGFGKYQVRCSQYAACRKPS